jgi:hypothetical protein
MEKTSSYNFYDQNEYPEIFEHVNKAGEYAREILTDKYVISNNCHKRSNNCRGGRFNYTSINVNSNNHYGRRNNNDNTGGVLVLGAILTIVSSFFLAKFTSKRNDALGQIRKAEDFKSVINKCKQNHPHEAFDSNLSRIEAICKTYKKIFKNRVFSQNINIGLTISSLATGALLVIGAIAASQVAILTGMIIGIGVGCGIAFKISYDFYSHEEKDQANKIIKLYQAVTGKTIDLRTPILLVEVSDQMVVIN